jgi:uncharacterized protein YbaP (TraB family)
MKKLFKSIVVVAVVLISSGFCTSKKSSLSTTKWKLPFMGISGKIKQNSYLYGTIHMMCDDYFFVWERKAFESSDKLVLEVNLSDPAELAVMQQMAMGKKP